ncbi:MAG: hypothetical protein JXB60_00130 [Candidatus Cloacimonetes bacterium]|nr:hypothetical protein [Candidatus Cloacimonadota bacterium]
MKVFMLMLFITAVFFLPAEIKIIFQDNFDNQDTGWATGDSEDRFLKIEDGKYIFSHKREEDSWFTWNSADIDQQENFSIKSNITHISGVDDYGYGIIWGMEDLENYYSFNVSANGYYRFAKEVDGNWYDIIAWTENWFDILGDDEIEIKRIEDRYEFYVNGYCLDTSSYEPLMGNRIGYVIYRNQLLHIDDLVVTQLPRYTEITESDLLLFDIFYDDENWLTKDEEEIRLEVSNNKYILDHKKEEGGWFTWHEIEDLNENRDFFIETELQHISGPADKAFGICWGLKDVDNMYFLFISDDGYYKFARYYEGEQGPIYIDWKHNPNIRTANATNKLEVRKIGRYYEIYCNDKFMDYAPYDGLLGKNLGFCLYGDTEVQVDYIKVGHLEGNYNYQSVDLTKSGLGKNFAAPEIRDGIVFVEYTQPVEDFNLENSRFLFNMMAMGFRGGAHIAQPEQTIAVKFHLENGQTRIYSTSNAFVQDFLNKLITQQEFIANLKIE